MRATWRAGCGLLLAAMPSLAQAHSFGAIYNLPVPLWLYLYGASAALLLTFVLAAQFATAEAPGRRLMRKARRTPRNSLGLRAAQALSLGLLLLCITSGVVGRNDARYNPNMTLFWVFFWLGVPYASALFGDFFSVINPWRLLCAALSRLFPHGLEGRWQYPRTLALWPAFALYLAWVWVELFAKVTPHSLALWLGGYTLLCVAGCWAFGPRQWLQRAECFHVVFRRFALLSPWRQRSLPPAAGLSGLMLVLALLAGTTFDGLHDSQWWKNLYWQHAYSLGLQRWAGADAALAYPQLAAWYGVWQTVALLVLPWLMLLLLWPALMLSARLAGGGLSARRLALGFAPSLLPIALAYHFAHYFTLLLTQAPQLLRMASDPFSRGWNLFGTAGWFRLGVIPDAARVWQVQVLVIVAGHALAVWHAQRRALTHCGDRRRALISHAPLLLVMLGFTSLGLWVLSLPLGTGGD